MRLIISAAVLVICLLQHTNGYCCFRDPLMLTPKCGCPDFYTPTGVISCPNTCTKTKPCGCSQPYSNTANMCACGQPTYGKCNTCLGSNLCESYVPACSCYRDTSNVCCVCDQPSPICSCLKASAPKGGAANTCGCGCQDMRSFIYFPEVEYPLVAIDAMKPYYGGCYTY